MDRNDVVLYDRQEDPGELHNLALDPTRHDLVAEYSIKLERLISQEVGADLHIGVRERPHLGAWPKWRGDEAA
jgi:arylsulfatase